MFGNNTNLNASCEVSIGPKKNVAFVASTMPFELLIKYHKLLEIGRVVCASKSLGESYQKGFGKLGFSLEVKVISGNLISRMLQLLKNIQNFNKTIIFHECCWWELDLLILTTKPETLYFPQVTLDCRRKVAIQEIPFKKRIKPLLKSKWFDFYETLVDGGGGYDLVPVLKKCYRHEVNILPASQIYKSCEVDEAKSNQIKRVLILSGRDLVPDDILIGVYNILIPRLLSAGVEVHAKDHPNPAARLNLQWKGMQTIDCELPLECLNLNEYCAIIGVVSTGLKSAITSGVAGISIIHLLPSDYRDELDRRMLHLKSLDVFPWLPRTIDELISQVLSVTCPGNFDPIEA